MVWTWVRPQGLEVGRAAGLAQTLSTDNIGDLCHRQRAVAKVAERRAVDGRDDTACEWENM